MTAGNPRVLQLYDFLKSIASPDISDAEIMGEAKSLIFLAPFVAWMDLPLSKAATVEQTRKELAELVKLSVRLLKHMDSMHATSLDAIRTLGVEMKVGGLVPFPDPIEVFVKLEKVTRVAHHAQGLDRFSGAAKNSGRPKKHAGRKIAELSARTFLRITGRPATRRTKPEDGKSYGPFKQMLSLVFCLTGFPPTSAENMAREAIRAMEKSPPKKAR